MFRLNSAPSTVASRKLWPWSTCQRRKTQLNLNQCLWSPPLQWRRRQSLSQRQSLMNRRSPDNWRNIKELCINPTRKLSLLVKIISLQEARHHLSLWNWKSTRSEVMTPHTLNLQNLLRSAQCWRICDDDPPETVITRRVLQRRDSELPQVTTLSSLLAPAPTVLSQHLPAEINQAEKVKY